MRRYVTLKPSRGTRIPIAIRSDVLTRDGWQCVGPKVGMPGACEYRLELDHVRASHAIGMKSETTAENLVSLCPSHHRMKTLEGRTWRPKLLAYLARSSGLIDATAESRSFARPADVD